MRSSARSMLPGLSLLSALSDSDLEWMLAQGLRERVPAGTMVVREHTSLDRFFVVLQGLLKVHLVSQGDRQVALLGAGNLFGEMSFIEARPTSASVSTVEDSELLMILRTDLDAKLQSDPAFAARLFRSLAVVISERLRETMGMMARIAEEPQSPEPDAYQRWQEIAERTHHFKSLLMKLEKEVTLDLDAALTKLTEEYDTFCRFINKAIGDGCPEPVNTRDDLGARIQREILPYLMSSRTIARLYQKPRGYAEDFLTNEMRYRCEPDGTGRSGALIDRCLLSLFPLTVVRQRSDYVARRIQILAGAARPPFRVTAIFSGTAPELFAAGAGLADGGAPHVSLIDFDAMALMAIDEQRGHRSGATPFRLVSTNLFDLALGRSPIELPPQNFVHSMSLLDYFDDRLVIKILNYMHRLLWPGGTALLTSFQPANPFKAFMQYVLNWQVNHRTPSEVEALFRASDFQSPCRCTDLDEEGIVFAAECRKN